MMLARAHAICWIKQAEVDVRTGLRIGYSGYQAGNMNRIGQRTFASYFAKGICTAFLAYATITLSLNGQTLTTLYTFPALSSNSSPSAGLVQGLDGNFYGTTYGGGANSSGTIFKVTPSGILTTLHSFCALPHCTDGSTLLTGLVQTSSGNFYGTTTAGGTNGAGTIFKVTPGGELTTLYSFPCPTTGTCEFGAAPNQLVLANDGNLYGTTYQYGTFFKVSQSGEVTTIPTSAPLGTPHAPLIQASNGDFYGTELLGGATGLGAVFRLTTSGTVTTLYSFCPKLVDNICPDGELPYAGLVQAADGDLYGTTSQGGTYSDPTREEGGTVFKITVRGDLTTLATFCLPGGCLASFSYDAMVQAADGTFYGTTLSGGLNDGGSVFKVFAGGDLSLVYSFCTQPDCADGKVPNHLIQDTDGDFYGTTGENGNDRGTHGTVFRLSVGLGPLVEVQPTEGFVGQGVEILGNTLLGTTGVSFNGKAAAFVVKSKSLILARVPAGATTGTVEVTGENGTLSSNVKFQVRR